MQNHSAFSLPERRLDRGKIHRRSRPNCAESLLAGGTVWRFVPGRGLGICDVLIEVIYGREERCRGGHSTGRIGPAGIHPAGGSVRAGWHLPDDFGVQTIDSITTTEGGWTHENITGRWGLFGFAGAQGNLVGLDQLNLRLPRALAGRGEAEIALTVDGIAANVVRVSIK